MNFGEKIDYLMIKNNLKYATEFAPNVGLSADTINQYRKKKIPERIDSLNLKKIADYFGVSVDYFFEEDIEEESIDEFQYINLLEGIENIDIEILISEIKTIIKNNECICKNKIINEEKKYVTDSLDIGLKLIKQNT